MVHERGIEISQKTIAAINKVVAPETKVELQSLIGKINFIRRFIANLSGKIQPFNPLLKLKDDQKFVWREAQQKALDEIKQYLTLPPVLVHHKSTCRLSYIYRLISMLSDRPLFKSLKEKNARFISSVEDSWMQKPGILLLKDYVFAYTFLVPSLNIIYYRLSVLW